MIKILIILLFIPPVIFSQPHKVTATVSGGNINVLTNAQTVYSLNDGDTLEIPVTATGYIGIGNITASYGSFIYVVVAGRITIGQMEIRNCINVKFIFQDPTYGWGVWMNSPGGRGLVIGDIIHNVWVHGVRIHSPGDFAVFLDHNRTFDNTYANKNTELTLDSVAIIKWGANGNAINFNDDSYNVGGVLKGVWDTVRLSNIVLDSAYGSEGFQFHNCFHINLRNIVATHNGGITDTIHAGMIRVRGHLESADSVYISDCWGNGFRLNCLALVPNKSAPRGDVRIHNVVIKNSRKYNPVEINNDNGQYDSSSMYLRPCNFYIEYSTMGASKYRGVAGQGSAFSIYTHGGGTISVIGCILYKSYIDAGGALPYTPTYYSGDGSPLPNDSTGTVYDPTGMTYLSDTANAISRVDMPYTVTGPNRAYITTSFNDNERPGRGNWRPGPYSYDGIDSGGSPTIKRVPKRVF